MRGSDIGMIFQEPMTSLNPVLTIGRQITETLEQHRGSRPSCRPEACGRTARSGRHRRPGAPPQTISRTSFRAACVSAS